MRLSGDLSMNEELEHLQVILLGKATDAYPCRITSVLGVVLDPAQPGLLAYSDEGILILGDRSLTTLRETPDTCDPIGIMLSDRVAFAPRPHCAVHSAAQQAAGTWGLAISDELGRSIFIEVADQAAVATLRDDGILEDSEDGVIADLEAVLANLGFATIESIASALEELPGWEGLDEDELSDLLYSPDCGAQNVLHNWFLREDAGTEPAESGSVAEAVLALLSTDTPAWADSIREALKADGWELDLEDVYDVLYDLASPSYKVGVLWFMPEQGTTED